MLVLVLVAMAMLVEMVWERDVVMWFRSLGCCNPACVCVCKSVCVGVFSLAGLGVVGRDDESQGGWMNVGDYG